MNSFNFHIQFCILDDFESNFFASNSCLNNTIQVYHLQNHFEKNVRKGKEAINKSKLNLNENNIKSL